MDAEMHKHLDTIEGLVNLLGIEFISLIAIFTIVLLVVCVWFYKELKDRATKAELHERLLTELLDSARKDYIESLNKTSAIMYESVKELTLHTKVGVEELSSVLHKVVQNTNMESNKSL